MKQVNLKQIVLTNFRGHKNLTVNFNGQTTISGENATGKSTVFDAFVWLLFGKDQFDRKDFEIIPMQNGNKLDKVDPEVSATIENDGREFSIKRTLHQKWVRKRGTAEEVFDGCDTLYYFNDVPLKAGEYKARIDLIIEETVFKLITNPNAFLSLHWTKIREFLFQIGGSLSDREIAATDPKFAKLLDLVNGKSLIEFKKELSARKRKLKEDLDNIQPRIDQTTRLMPDTKDFTSIEAEISEVEDKIKAIDLEISDKAAAIRGQYEEIRERQSKINDLKTKQRELVNNANIQSQEKAHKDNQERSDLAMKVSHYHKQLDNIISNKSEAENLLKSLRQKETALNEELSKLRASWQAESEKEYQEKEGCLICPLFGNECTDATAIEASKKNKESAKESFNNAKDSRLNQINGEGLSKKEELKAIQSRIEKGLMKVDELTEMEISAKADYEASAETLKNTPAVVAGTVIASSMPEWVELENNISDLEAVIEGVKPVDTSDLNEKKSGYVSKRDDLKTMLADKDLIKKYNLEIKNLEKQGSDIAQQIAYLENQEFTIDAFNKVKIDQLESRINGMFSIVKFKLFDKTNDGNEFEACIPTNKAGVPISATNTAEQINAGLDIIKTLSGFYNVSAPIFCDGAESVNSYMNTGAQMIFLRVTKEPALTIN